MAIRFSRPNQPPPEPPKHVILASQSMGRKALLEKLGIRFRVAVSRIDEVSITDKDPVSVLKKRAAAKAHEIVSHPRVYNIAEEAKTLVIAADSMAIVGKKTYGKAEDRDDAKRIIKALMGKTHTFVTAVHCVFIEQGHAKKHWEKVVKTKVTLKKLAVLELDSYIARYDFTRYAAGYALNDAPWDLVTKVDGSYTNVIGLPFEILLPILRKLEIIV